MPRKPFVRCNRSDTHMFSQKLTVCIRLIHVYSKQSPSVEEET